MSAQAYDITSLSKKKHELLKSILEDLHQSNLIPKIGIELELYLETINSNSVSTTIKSFIKDLKISLLEQHIDLLEIEEEQGRGQIEIKTNPYDDICKLCQDIILIKQSVVNLTLSQYHDIKPIFLSQPQLDDCGSALQINISLIDQDGNPYFTKNNQNSSNDLLLCSVGGILAFAKNIILIMAPKEEDYTRFDLQINNRLHRNGKYTAPTHISWGYNNRTSLIRVILNSNNISKNRLEFRMPSPQADIYLALSFFLLSMLEGIRNKMIPQNPTYGNSFDQQYLLDTLPKNLEIAKEIFLEKNAIKRIMTQKLQKCIN